MDRLADLKELQDARQSLDSDSEAAGLVPALAPTSSQPDPGRDYIALDEDDEDGSEEGEEGETAQYTNHLFNKEVASVKQTLGVLRMLVEAIGRDHEDWASVGDYWASEASSDPLYPGLQNEAAMHERADSVRERSEEARKQLTEMQERTQEYEKYLQQTTTSRSQTGAAIKMRRNQAAALTRKLEEVTSAFLDQESSFKEKRESVFEQQYRAFVNKNADDDEVRLAKEQEKSVFAIDGADLERARSNLNEVEQIHRELRRTEKEISEVCELLAQLHQMTEANGEQMDRIEAWVAQDLHQVKAGVKDLELANEYARSRRKKMVMLACCAMIIVVVVAGPVLALFVPDI